MRPQAASLSEDGDPACSALGPGYCLWAAQPDPACSVLEGEPPGGSVPKLPTKSSDRSQEARLPLKGQGVRMHSNPVLLSLLVPRV